jgi:hypothetical protein
VQLGCRALSTSQSRPRLGRVLSQPLLDEREASGCSVSFCIRVDELGGRPFLHLTRTAFSRKASLFAQGNWIRPDDRTQHSTPRSPVQFSCLRAVAGCTLSRSQLRPYHGIVLGNLTQSSAGSERVVGMWRERPWGRALRISWNLLLACWSMSHENFEASSTWETVSCH